MISNGKACLKALKCMVYEMTGVYFILTNSLKHISILISYCWLSMEHRTYNTQKHITYIRIKMYREQKTIEKAIFLPNLL